MTTQNQFQFFIVRLLEEFRGALTSSWSWPLVIVRSGQGVAQGNLQKNIEYEFDATLHVVNQA
jgi:hypothetical protein